MPDLNYRHLQYFQAVARDGNLTRAAGRMNLSQSALSTQIRQLEARLGHALFDRKGRRLVLTEAGRIALDHADRIFGAGKELLATLDRQGGARRTIRIGASATLSRNFQLRFLRPVLGRDDVELVLQSATDAELLRGLRSLALDVALSTEPPARDADARLVAHLVGEQRVQVHGTPARMDHPTLAALLAAEPVILPTESSIRTGFDALVARLGIRPQIAAEVDDMAMVRLLAREGFGLAIAPAVVLEGEIASGLLRTAPFDLAITETFYATTMDRQFPDPIVADLVSRAAAGR